ncbi:MAG: 3-hydroxyacyl-CoA dehydrogenase family protein [Bacteroidia bacterium]|nr:3-hydroxyacyl-CoA dehydrogenase family protein [Bacteroidia bacterium]
MRALAIGSVERLAALQAGIGKRWHFQPWVWQGVLPPDLHQYPVWVDTEADERPSPLLVLEKPYLLLLNAVKKPLRRLLPDPSWAEVSVGVNLLPGFCLREVLEASALSDGAWQRLLAFEPQSLRSPDRIGMVSPRILCLVLNEALLLSGEAQLNLPVLDQAVKLGLNYPRSISEWGELIGWRHVREVVEALQTEYGAGVYPVAPTLFGM